MDIGMALSHRCIMETTLETTLELLPGIAATDTIFPGPESRIAMSSLMQKALLHVISRKRLEMHRSIIDALVCVVEPEVLKWCFAWYATHDERILLRNIINKPMWTRMNAMLHAALDVALISRIERLRAPRTMYTRRISIMQRQLTVPMYAVCPVPLPDGADAELLIPADVRISDIRTAATRHKEAVA